MDNYFEIGEGVLMVIDGNYLKLVNPATGKERVLSSCEGILLVDDSEIDFDTIWKVFGEGKGQDKSLRYGFNRYSDFKNGICAFGWTIYPDGMWFADQDGFGMEDNNEEKVYCIMNSDFEILMPFRPVKDIRETLKMYQKDSLLPDLENKSEDIEEETNITSEESKEIKLDLSDKLGLEEKEFLNMIWVMEPVNIVDDIYSPIELCQTEDMDESVIVAGIQETEESQKILHDWEKEIKLGEKVLIYCGKNDYSGSSWWELEFEAGAFSGPIVNNPDMGNYIIFNLKSLKKGNFKIRVMNMAFEPYYSSLEYSGGDNHDVPKVQFEFTVGVSVL